MKHWGGLFCFLGAITLYFISPRTRSDIEFLESATRVHKLKDLQSKVFPLIVAVSGIVGSETDLIKCEHSDIFGVIIEETVEQQFLKRNWKFSWVKDRALMEPVSKEVPWYLDDGTGRVNVTGAHDATSLVLTFGSEVFEKQEPSPHVCGFFDSLRGLEMIGVRRIDRVLQIGTQLNIVGEVVKDGFGNVKIQKPEKGFYYVSHIPLDQFIYESGNSSRWFKYAYIGLTILGVILILKDKIVYSIVFAIENTTYILARRQQQRERQREREQQLQREREWQQQRERLLQNSRRVEVFVDGASKRAEQATKGLERQHENKSNANDYCVICLEKKYNAVYIPCKHMCCCITCSSRVKTCPLCRKHIGQVLQVFRH